MTDLQINAALPRCGPNPDWNPAWNSTEGLQAMIRSLPCPGLVVEVGSNRGVSTETFALLCGNVVAVDYWPGGGHDLNAEQDFEEMRKRRKNVSVLRLPSILAAKLFAPHSVDLVYLDAGHDRGSVMMDILHWHNKIKPGGYISGHDFQDNYQDLMNVVSHYFGIVRVWPDSSWLSPVNNLRK